MSMTLGTTAKDLMSAGLLEKLADQINRSLNLPYDVTVRATECGEANAYYNPATKEVIMCYEYVDYLARLAVEEVAPSGLSKEVVGAFIPANMIFVFYHELGHALIDIYDLKVTGKEENVADQFAVIALHHLTEDHTTDSGTDFNKLYLIAVQVAFAIAYNAESTIPGYEHPYWDEHDSSGQRFTNIACLLYGSDQIKYSHLVPDHLPQSRAVFCPDAFERADGAWEDFLEDHRIQ